MNKMVESRVFNSYLTDSQIYEFVGRFKGKEINSQDFNDRRCLNKLAIFKAFRYGLDSNVNLYNYLKPDHMGNSAYKANFEALEYCYRDMIDSLLKCRTFINRVKKLSQCQCVDSLRPTNNVSAVPDDIYYLGEVLLSLNSRITLVQTDYTLNMIQKTIAFAKKNMNKNVALFQTLGKTKKRLMFQDEEIDTSNLKNETDSFFENLSKYSKNLRTIYEFMDENKLDSMESLNKMAEECFDVSAQMYELEGPKTKVKAISSEYHDSQDVDCHAIWGYDNLVFPMKNKNFIEKRPHNKPVRYFTEDGESYVRGSLTQKALASMDVPFM